MESKLAPQYSQEFQRALYMGEKSAATIRKYVHNVEKISLDEFKAWLKGS